MFSRPFAITSYRISSKSNLTNIACHRSLHLACRNLKKNFIVYSEQKYKTQLPMISVSFIRHQSASSQATNTSTNASASVGQTESSAAATAPTTVEKNSVHMTEEVSSIKEIEEWFTVLEKVDSTEIQDRVGHIPFQKIVDSCYAQDSDPAGVENLISQIPEPPTPILQEVVEVLAGEPTLASLGLGSSWPSGWIQHLLNWMHITGGLPWWATIVITTVCARLILFPVVIKMQRYTAKMHNVQPQIQSLQAEMSEARKMGDHMEVARLSHELYAFMKQNGIDPLKNAVFPLIQAPIFLSFFWGIRGMVHAPVESMKTGGLYWFSDLTVPDPLYILPILTSTTLFITIKTGTDFMRVDSMGNFRYVMQAAPFIMFPFIMNFEGAILCYWVSTNIFSLAQVSLLRLPKVRTYFDIPVMVRHDINKLPATKKKFVQGFKDSWTNMKVAREVNARAQYDEIVFHKAGQGPVPKTYKFDPTKIIQLPPNASQSKSIISHESSDATFSKSKTNRTDSTKMTQPIMPVTAILSKKKDD